jgi:hypothetical protein
MSTEKKTSIKIPICGIPWNVHFITTKQIDKLNKDVQLLGLTDPIKQEIYVDYQRTRVTVMSTFFHEFTHACVANLQGSNESAQGAVNEEVCANCIGNAMVELLPFLQDIIELVEALIPKDEDK